MHTLLLTPSLYNSDELISGVVSSAENAGLKSSSWREAAEARHMDHGPYAAACHANTSVPESSNSECQYNWRSSRTGA